MKQKRKIPKAVQGDLDIFYSFLSKMRSPNTLRAYINDLDDFACFAAENGVKNVRDIDHVMIRKYLGCLSEDHMRSSMNRKLAALRSFFGFMKKNGAIDADPSKKVRSGKTLQKYPDVLSIREVGNIFSLDFGNGKLGLRDRALLEFLYSTGCRVQEAALLDKRDIDLLGETAVVSGKGSKERIVPLGGQAVVRLHGQQRGEARHEPIRAGLVALPSPADVQRRHVRRRGCCLAQRVFGRHGLLGAEGRGRGSGGHHHVELPLQAGPSTRLL